ncbi:unnamed protein product [Cyprideis torosa]|uniref:Sodium/hydrogen exchanger n=1 Tax=Cyprideis torosa TaxID=163714 RepID=A0A7R8WDQ8_9CRUS|nr:unnamed protein product [Cyprideis torosa]CAG0888622.1 unnamed protein product [Cyprideis torosa]
MEEVFKTTVPDLEAKCREAKIEILARKSFQSNPAEAIAALKRLDARIIVGLFYAGAARKVLCEIYHQKLYGRSYVWLLIGWYEDNWYQANLEKEGINCTADQMREAAEGHITTEARMWNTDNSITVSGSTTAEFGQRLIQRLKERGYAKQIEQNSMPEGYQEAPLAYDAVWAAALALNKTMEILRLQGRSLVREFDYSNREIAKIIYNSMDSIKFLGVSGSLQFSSGDRISWTKIEQMTDGKYHILGYYDTHSDNLTWHGTVKWVGGKPPPDQTVVRYQRKTVSLGLLIVVSFLSFSGTVAAIALIVFMYMYRTKRFIRHSQPTCNIITLVGITVCLTGSCLLGLDGRLIPYWLLPWVCQARAWLLTIGFSLSYGAMFAKIWSVHSLATKAKAEGAPKPQSGPHRPWLMVCFFIVVDVTILIVWTVTDPMVLEVEDLPFELPDNTDEDIKIRPQLEHCVSVNNDIWLGVLYAYKGLLLIFGLFLSYETRSVKLKLVNDSRFVGMAIYNVVVLCGITAPVSLVIASQPDASFAFVNFSTIFCCLISMGLIFTPKIVEIIRYPNGRRADSRHSTNGIPSTEDTQKLQKILEENEELQKMLDLGPLSLVSFRASRYAGREVVKMLPRNGIVLFWLCHCAILAISEAATTGHENDTNGSAHHETNGSAHHHTNASAHHETNGSAQHGHGHHEGISLVHWQWDELKTLFTASVFIFLAGIVKLCFHNSTRLSSLLPESCVLIILGMIVGAISHWTGIYSHVPQLTPYSFLYWFLPPIVLESAYSLRDRVFFNNLGSILIFAVVGTLINAFALGGTLYFFSLGGMGFPEGLRGVDILLFSIIISAVDPVSVLAIFQEIAINKDIYFLVFGESLLNDAVVIVLYSALSALARLGGTIPGGQYGMAIASFFTISFGGMLIGTVYGFASAFLAKYTHHVRAVESLSILLIAYISYLSAELFHFSGIMSLIMCGLIQAQYALPNLTKKSYLFVKYFTKLLAAVNDTVVFLLLGMAVVHSHEYKWNISFVLWTLVLTLAFRFATVFTVTPILNKRRLRKVNPQEMFIMAYSGLRGAVGFALVLSVDETVVEPKELFVTTTVAVVLFTVFVQGATIKPLLNLFKIRRQEKLDKSLLIEIGANTEDNIMAGIEMIVGRKGNFTIRKTLEYYDQQYLKPIFQSKSAEEKLALVYQKLALNDHYANLYGPSMVMHDEGVTVSEEDEEVGVMETIDDLDEEEGLDITETTSMRSRPVSPQPRSLSPRKTVSPSPSGERFTVSDDHAHVTRTTSDRPRTLLRMLTRGNMGMSVRNVRGERRDSRDSAVSKMPDTADIETLRKALVNSPFNKYHQRFNRNMMDDEFLELDMHLKRRHQQARRISHLVEKKSSALEQPPPEPLPNGSVTRRWNSAVNRVLNRPLSQPTGGKLWPGVQQILAVKRTAPRRRAVSETSARGSPRTGSPVVKKSLNALDSPKRSRAFDNAAFRSASPSPTRGTRLTVISEKNASSKKEDTGSIATAELEESLEE